MRDLGWAQSPPRTGGPRTTNFHFDSENWTQGGLFRRIEIGREESCSTRFTSWLLCGCECVPQLLSWCLSTVTDLLRCRWLRHKWSRSGIPDALIVVGNDLVPVLALLVAWLAVGAWATVASVLVLPCGTTHDSLLVLQQAVALPFLIGFALVKDGLVGLKRPLDIFLVTAVGSMAFFWIYGTPLSLHYLPGELVHLSLLATPVLITAVSYCFGTEACSLLHAVGTSVAVGGAVLVMLNAAGGDEEALGVEASDHWWVGAITVSGQVLCATGACFLMKHLMVDRGYPAATLATWCVLVCIIASTTACLVPHGIGAHSFTLDGDWRAWMALIYGSLIATCFGANIVAWTLYKLPLSLVATSAAFYPLVTSLFASVVDQSAVVPETINGGLMVLIGLLVSTIVQQKSEREKDDRECDRLERRQAMQKALLSPTSVVEDGSGSRDCLESFYAGPPDELMVNPLPRRGRGPRMVLGRVSPLIERARRSSTASTSSDGTSWEPAQQPRRSLRPQSNNPFNSPERQKAPSPTPSHRHTLRPRDLARYQSGNHRQSDSFRGFSTGSVSSGRVGRNSIDSSSGSGCGSISGGSVKAGEVEVPTRGHFKSASPSKSKYGPWHGGDNSGLFMGGSDYPSSPESAQVRSGQVDSTRGASFNSPPLSVQGSVGTPRAFFVSPPHPAPEVFV
ncbi:unnamed protein product [Chrysoparadoxa australica]